MKKPKIIKSCTNCEHEPDKKHNLFRGKKPCIECFTYEHWKEKGEKC